VTLALYDAMSTLAFEVSRGGPTVFAALRQTRQRSGGRHVAVEDPSGPCLSYDRLIMSALALGRRLVRETRPAEPVGLLLGNAAATAVTFMALQANGRVPAMLNYAGGEAVVAGALATARIQTVIT